MIIKEINISSFGNLDNTRFGPLANGLVIFLGNNEAGKSTILAFIRAIFFGFPDKRSNANDFTPLHNGIFGGKLTLEDSKGRLIYLERKVSFHVGKKNKKPELTIFSPDIRNTITLKDVFGGITQKIYNNIFAFGLNELERLDLLKHGEIKEAIYGASLGVSFLKFPNAQKTIKKKMDALFKGQGQKQLINKTIKEYKEINKEIKQVQNEIEQFNIIKKELQNIERDIDKLEKNKKTFEKQLAWLTSLEESIDDYIKFQTISNQISNLKKSTNKKIDEKTIFQLENSEKIIIEKRKILDKIIDDIKNLEQRKNSITLDKNLILKKEEIQNLYITKEQFLNLKNTIEFKNKHLINIESKFIKILNELGPTWDKEKIKNFHINFNTKTIIKSKIEKIKEVKNELEQISHKINLRKKDLKNKIILKNKNQEKIKKIEKNIKLNKIELNEIILITQELIKIKNKEDEFYNQLNFLKNNLKNSLKKLDIKFNYKNFIQLDINKLHSQANNIINKYTEIKNRLEAIKNLLFKEEIKYNQLNNSLNDRIVSIDKLLERYGDKNRIKDILSLKKEFLNGYNQRFAIQEKIDELNQDILELDKKENNLVKKVKTNNLFLRLNIILAGIGTVASFFLKNNSKFIIFFVILNLIMSTLFYIRVKKLNHKIKTILKKRDFIKERLNKLKITLDNNIICQKEIINSLKLDDNINISELLKILDDIEEKKQIIAQLEQEIHSIREDIKNINDTIDQLKEQETAINDKLTILKKNWKEFFLLNNFDKEISMNEFEFFIQDLYKLKNKAIEIEELQEKIDNLQKEFDNHLENLKKISNESIKISTKDELTVFWEKLKDYQIKLQSIEKLNEKLNHQEKEIGVLKKELISLIIGKKKLQQKLLQHKNSYYNLLNNLNILQKISPETFFEFLKLLEDAKELINEIEELKKEINNHSNEKKELIKELKKLFNNLLPNYNFQGHESDFDLLIKLTEEENKKKEKIDSLNNKLQVLYNNKDITENEIENKEKKISDILNRYNLESASELKEQFQRQKKLYNLESELDNITIKLTTKLDKEIEEIINIFQSKKAHEIKAEKNEIIQLLENCTLELKKIYEKKAQLKEKMQRLRESQELQRLLLEKEALKKTLYDLSKKWATFSVAQTLLDLAKDTFEKENQPEVISRASKYFQKITSGRYKQVIFLTDKNELAVLDKIGRKISVDKLSRGTGEQLYLALRFGMIPICEPKDEKLPIIMDDILVNFDPNRMKEAAESISTLSKERQILFFTCHPEIKKTFEQINPKLHVIELSDKL